MQVVVFGTKTDASLMNMLKASSLTAAEALQQAPLSDMTAEIKQLLALETASENQSKPAVQKEQKPEARDKLATVRDLVMGISEKDEIDESKLPELEAHFESIERQVKHFIKLVTNPDSDTPDKLQELLDGTCATMALRGNSKAVLLFDRKCAGEASATPHSRLPPFQQKQLRMLVQAWHGARSDASLEDDPLGVVLVLDGMRPGLDGSIGTCFAQKTGNKHIQKVKVPFTLTYDQDALEARKCVVRGFVPQSETMYCYSTEMLELPTKKRLHFQGNNKGSLLGPIVMNRHEESWRLSPADRTNVLGSACKVLVGGADQQRTPKPVFDDGKDPICWHSPPDKFYAEVIHSWCVGAIVNATETDGLCALEALKQKVPYLGICHTEAHCEKLRERIIRLVWEESLKEKSPLYSAPICKILCVQKAVASPKRKRLNLGSQASSKRSKIMLSGQGQGGKVLVTPKGRGKGKGKKAQVSDEQILSKLKEMEGKSVGTKTGPDDELLKRLKAQEGKAGPPSEPRKGTKFFLRDDPDEGPRNQKTD
ncbi:unnamed protein product [Symbiodinium sp. CCMP2592]|nr:unnamed protein product [Symbiodinium sp. CCMP2592]